MKAGDDDITENNARIDAIIMAVKRARQCSEAQKRYHARIRIKTINFLGGKCKHSGCEERDPAKLDIHHVHPHGNGGYSKSPGCAKLQFWRNILSGKEEGELYCKEHHVADGHDGNMKPNKR